MKKRQIIVDFCVTIALLIVMAGFAIFGISSAMEPLSSINFANNFGTLNADSVVTLLKMHRVLKLTCTGIMVMLFISIVIKSLQLIKREKERF